MLKLGNPARCPFTVSFFGWEDSATKIDYRKKGTLILTSLLEDLVMLVSWGLVQGKAMGNLSFFIGMDGVWRSEFPILDGLAQMVLYMP